MQTTSERQLAIREARRLLELDLVIFDTETTGLGPDAEIVEIAALKVDGTVLLDTLVKPRQSSRRTPRRYTGSPMKTRPGSRPSRPCCPG